MPDTYTIAAAARLCHCDRRTLQRAIHSGRLHLDSAHHLSRDELIATGYLLEHEMSLEAPHIAPLEAPLLAVLEQMSRLFGDILAELRHIREAMALAPLATPHQTPQAAPQPQPSPPPRDTTRQEPSASAGYDPSRYVLGRLCPRGHEYQQTGQTLRSLLGRKCRQCELEGQRERRRLTRERLTQT